MNIKNVNTYKVMIKYGNTYTVDSRTKLNNTIINCDTIIYEDLSERIVCWNDTWGLPT